MLFGSLNTKYGLPFTSQNEFFSDQMEERLVRGVLYAPARPAVALVAGFYVSPVTRDGTALDPGARRRGETGAASRRGRARGEVT